MKRAVAVLIMLLVIATAATASETDWRVRFNGDNGAGLNAGPGCQFGVYPTSIEQPDSQDGQPWSPIHEFHTSILLMSPIPGSLELYSRNIKAPSTPPKSWEFYVAGDIDCPATQIRLLAYTGSSTTLPTPTWQGTPLKYFVRMLDNKGVEGAPGNGTIWEMPTPTMHTTTPYWVIPENLPMLKLSQCSPGAIVAEGYHLEFVQEVVPEPSSLPALGSGLLALGGLTRRRRA